MSSCVMSVVAKAHCLLWQGTQKGHQGITLKASILGYEYYRWGAAATQSKLGENRWKQTSHFYDVKST